MKERDILTGTIINAGAIVAAGSIGLILRKGIPEKMSSTMQDGLALLVLVIGIQYGFKADNLAVVALSLASGAIIGEWRQWEARLEQWGLTLQNRFGKNNGEQFAKGFVTATLLFCVGAMAVIGSLEDGLTGNYQILLVKSILDGIFAMLFAASMGIGVLFSAIPVLIYQGAITLGAGYLKPLMTDPMLNNITSCGGIIIAGLGLNLLKLTHIRVANLLPGLIILPFIMLLFSFLNI